jgi:hypothetical protein
MKKYLVISSFALAIGLSSCLALIKGQQIATGADPVHLAGLTGDIGLTNTNQPNPLRVSNKTPVTKTSPLPVSAAFPDGEDLNKVIARSLPSFISLTLKDVTAWKVCYGFKKATITGVPNGTTLPNTITLSSVSTTFSVQDASASSTNPSNASIVLTKNASGGYDIAAVNNKICADIPGTTLDAINTVLSNGTPNNTVTGSLTYTVDQDITIGGSPVLKLEFDEGTSTIVI